MNIQKTVRYRFEGQEFRDLNAVKTYVENQIGKILDDMPTRMPSKQALEVFEAITKNKDRLRFLLGVEIESEEWDGETQNILDFEH